MQHDARNIKNTIQEYVEILVTENQTCNSV